MASIRISEIFTSRGLGIPTGAVMMFLSTAIPDGWLELNGATHNVTDYKELGFLLTGSTTGTFKLPNMSQRFPMGPGGGFDVGDDVPQQVLSHKHATTYAERNGLISNNYGTSTGKFRGSAELDGDNVQHLTNDGRGNMWDGITKVNPDGVVGTKNRPDAVVFVFAIKT